MSWCFCLRADCPRTKAGYDSAYAQKEGGDSMFVDLLLKSWRTTAVGLVTGIAALLVNYGIELTPEAQQKATELIVALGVTLLGIFGKDGNVSGTKENN